MVAALAPATPGASVSDTSPLTPAEQSLLRDWLAEEDVAVPSEPAALVRVVLDHASRELGQSVRPKSLDPLWGYTPTEQPVERGFQQARIEGRLAQWLSRTRPDHPQYARLRAAARRYRALAARPFNPAPALPTLREGDIHPQLGEVRRRLNEEGFPPPPSARPELFDAALASAVTRFQAREGIEADGVLGPRTLQALNTSPAHRLARLEANLERLRWLPRPLPADRVEVNVAAADAGLYRGGRNVLSMKVVVGDLRHKTPLFASRLTAVVFNPPWNVPESIAAGEILPRARREADYLARNGFFWAGGRLQQKPGPGNALGRIKFDLPSPYGVYLHDTPVKSAFARPVRTLSHGCMRLEKPEALALALLSPQGWTEADVQRAIEAGATRRVAIDQPLALLVTYQTAWVDPAGELRFAPDVYGWDAKLSARLPGRTQGKLAARLDSECSGAPAA
jgi:murein L,D-transpeptidase YcbB/YkuD